MFAARGVSNAPDEVSAAVQKEIHIYKQSRAQELTVSNCITYPVKAMEKKTPSVDAATISTLITLSKPKSYIHTLKNIW